MIISFVDETPSIFNCVNSEAATMYEVTVACTYSMSVKSEPFEIIVVGLTCGVEAPIADTKKVGIHAMKQKRKTQQDRTIFAISKTKPRRKGQRKKRRKTTEGEIKGWGAIKIGTISAAPYNC